MEVNLNLKSDPLLQAGQRPPQAVPLGPVRDRAAFENLDRLGQDLNALPVVRPEAVSRGQELLSAVDYPPEKTMESIATLLAAHLRAPSLEAQ